MRQRLLLWIAVLFASFAYQVATTYAIALLWVAPPDWWHLSMSKVVDAYAWLHSVHFAALLIASIPFAAVLAISRTPQAFALGLVIATLGLILPVLITSVRMLGGGDWRFWMFSALDIAKFATVLPALTWLMGLAITKLPRSGGPKQGRREIA